MSDREKTQPSEASSTGGDESLDSLLKAVARVPSVPLGPESTVSGLSATALAHTSSGPIPVLPAEGTVLGGRYELLSMLGSGGMGAVYAARNLRTGKEVAVKVLLPEQQARSERVERFVREARAAGRIRHPNVVDVYDVEGDVEMPYIVMERLHGESLRARMVERTLDAEAAVKLLLGAMRGVIEAHQQGVIHRDLKPENIFLTKTPTSSEPLPKVLDFGVSRMLAHDETGPAPTTLTRTGHVVGTPSYMSLEQLRGSAEVGVFADVYALGVIVYEALAGKRPFDAPNTHELVIRMATELPVPLVQRAPQVDPTLASIVMKALARDPQQRHQSVTAFAQALERWLAGERTVQATPEHAVEPAARTRPWLVPVLVAVLVLGLTALWWSVRDRDPLPSQPPVAPSSAAREPTPSPATTPVMPEPAPTREQPVTSAPPEPPPAPPASARPRTAKRKASKTDRATHLRVEDF